MERAKSSSSLEVAKEVAAGEVAEEATAADSVVAPTS